MLGEAKALLYQTELLLPPIPQLKIDKDRVRKLFNHLHDSAGHRYANIDQQGSAPTLTTKRGDEIVSSCKFEPYSITISERSPEFGEVDEFVAIVRRVLGGLGELSPVFSQRCRIQCCYQPAIRAVPLLAGKVANVFKKIGPFGRPPLHFGIKFRFPPAVEEPDDEPDDEVDDSDLEAPPEVLSGGGDTREPVTHHGDVTLRIETHGKEASDLWMEAAVSHYFEEAVTLPDDFDEVGENIAETYQFLTIKSKNFLNQFDRPDDESTGGL